MQTPAIHEHTVRTWRDRSRPDFRYCVGRMHLGSETQDPGVSPVAFPPRKANVLGGEIEVERSAQFAHFIPAPLPVPAQRYGAYPELLS